MISGSVLFQVFDNWYQSLPRWYTVKDFMSDVNQWYSDGYVDRDIWTHLQKYVEADVLSVCFSQLTVASGKTMVTGTSYQLSEEGKIIINICKITRYTFSVQMYVKLCFHQ